MSGTDEQSTDIESGPYHDPDTAAAKIQKGGASSRKVGLLSPQAKTGYGIAYAVLFAALGATIIAHLMMRDNIKNSEETPENLARMEAMLTYFWIGYGAELMALFILTAQMLVKLFTACGMCSCDKKTWRRAEVSDNSGTELTEERVKRLIEQEVRRRMKQMPRNSLPVDRRRRKKRQKDIFGQINPDADRRSDDSEDGLSSSNEDYQPPVDAKSDNDSELNPVVMQRRDRTSDIERDDLAVVDESATQDPERARQRRRKLHRHQRTKASTTALADSDSAHHADESNSDSDLAIHARAKVVKQDKVAREDLRSTDRPESLRLVETKQRRNGRIKKSGLRKEDPRLFATDQPQNDNGRRDVAYADFEGASRSDNERRSGSDSERGYGAF